MLSRNTYSDFASGSTRAHQHLSDTAVLQAILRFEKELADAAFACSAVTSEQAESARAAIDGYVVDLEDIARRSAAGANPVIPIVHDLKAAATDNTAIHYQATSQDALDSALSWCVKQTVEEVKGELGGVDKQLRDLAAAHRTSPVMARTLGQQALPTTFGAVVAGWLEGLAQATEALAACTFPVQYAGPAGTLPGGVEVHHELARRLDLATTPLVWHTNRQPLAEVAVAAARVAGAVRKIAGDIIMYSATEVAELQEASPGGSSSMPHKANPAASVACDGYARRIPGLAATMLDSLDSRAQRGTGSWHAEWSTIREIIACTASAVTCIHRALDGLIVNTDTMAAACGKDPDVAHATAIVDTILERNPHV